MIDVAISFRPVNDENVTLRQIPVPIQLALYQYDIYIQNRNMILKEIKENFNKIKVVHLPIDTLKVPFEKVYDMVRDIFIQCGCKNFVIHPNKNIENFLQDFRTIPLVSLCVETFAWKKKKVYRTPLEIIEACLRYKNVWMTIDTCHIEELWFDPKILSYLLKYTKVIHLSNRAKGFGSHIPFNHPKGELNLVSFVKQLKRRYNWEGTIVLEYMSEYSHKLLKNHDYVKRLVNET